MTARVLKLGCPYLRSYSPLRWGEMEDNEEILALLNGAAVDIGIIGEAILLIGTNPSADETVVMGTGAAAETYVFKVAAASAFQVTIGADAAGSIVNLVAKVAANTVLKIKPSGIVGGFKIQHADAANGTPTVGTIDAALAETLGAVADVWNQDNLNATGRVNYLYRSSLPVEITAENIATVFTVPLGFTPLEFTYRFIDTNGLPKPSCTSIVEIDGNGLKVTVTSGGSAAIATDVVILTAQGNVLV